MSFLKPLVLVVDDDPGLVKLLKGVLEVEGFRVATAGDGKRALQLIDDEEPDLVLLDIMMPGMDGFQVCEHIRKSSGVPIIMLTAKASPEDMVHGLDLGADDYVIKPFGIGELLARVKAVLRRTKYPEEIVRLSFASGKLCIDFTRHQVTLAGEEVVLTPIEYRVLCLLARNAGKVITHSYLLSQVWGSQCAGDTHLLQVAVARIRKKIGDDPGNPSYIVTRPHIGYAFKGLAQCSESTGTPLSAAAISMPQ